jgi:hypothetical protein
MVLSLHCQLNGISCLNYTHKYTSIIPGRMLKKSNPKFLSLLQAFMYEGKLSVCAAVIILLPENQKALSKTKLGVNCLYFVASTPLWSSGQSFWLQIQRSCVRFPALPDFLRSSGSGTGSNQPREDK